MVKASKTFLQCFDTSGWAKEGHPVCKIPDVTILNSFQLELRPELEELQNNRQAIQHAHVACV